MSSRCSGVQLQLERVHGEVPAGAGRFKLHLMPICINVVAVAEGAVQGTVPGGVVFRVWFRHARVDEHVAEHYGGCAGVADDACVRFKVHSVCL